MVVYTCMRVVKSSHALANCYTFKSNNLIKQLTVPGYLHCLANSSSPIGTQ